MSLEEGVDTYYAAYYSEKLEYGIYSLVSDADVLHKVFRILASYTFSGEMIVLVN